MVISAYDRLQALVRNRQYLRDLEALQGRLISPEADELCRKYKLSSPITQERIKLLELSNKVAEHSMPEDEFTTRIIRHGNKNSYTLSSQETIEGIGHKYYTFNCTAWLRDNRYLTTEIDLTKKKKDIVVDVSNYVDMFSKFIANPLRTTRNKSTAIDPWVVYDMHQNDGLNFSQIARRLSGIKGHPTYNSKLDAYLKKVKRAYERAKAIECKIDQEVENLMDE